MILPRLYPILDTESLARREFPPPRCAGVWLEAGAAILQFRHKGHWSRAVFEEARQVAALCREHHARCVIDDRADMAALLGAGLHVGQDDLAPRDARRILGAEAVLGFSSHNAEQLRAAAGEPVTYVAFGPVFPTTSKRQPDPVVGLEELRRCRALTDKPLVAIGGIRRDNALSVFQAGADSVAVIADLLPDPTTARSLGERMSEWLQLVTK